MGPVRQRAAVGNGPRGLQRRRRGVGLPAPRPRPVPRVPMGRGRHGRVLRHRAAAVPGPGAVERARPDPQGAAVRADRRRRPTTARTSRSTGGTSTPCPATPGTGGATTTRRRAFPYAGPRRRERPPRQARPGVRAARHGRLRRRPLLDRRGRLRQGRPRRPADGGPGHQRRARTRPRCTCCPTAWFRNTWSWERRRPTARAARPPAAGTVAIDHPFLGELELLAGAGPGRRRADAAVLRERDQHRRACTAVAPVTPYPKDGINDHVVSRRRHGEPRTARAPSARSGTG